MIEHREAVVTATMTIAIRPNNQLTITITTMNSGAQNASNNAASELADKEVAHQIEIGDRIGRAQARHRRHVER